MGRPINPFLFVFWRRPVSPSGERFRTLRSLPSLFDWEEEDGRSCLGNRHGSSSCISGTTAGTSSSSSTLSACHFDGSIAKKGCHFVLLMWEMIIVFVSCFGWFQLEGIRQKRAAEKVGRVPSGSDLPTAAQYGLDFIYIYVYKFFVGFCCVDCNTMIWRDSICFFFLGMKNSDSANRLSEVRLWWIFCLLFFFLQVEIWLNY